MRRIVQAALAMAILVPGINTSVDARVLYVTEYGGGLEDGSSWEDAYYSIQAALDAASDGDEVWVAAGTYYENLNVSRALSLYGGFAGTEVDITERDLSEHVTTIDADSSGAGLVSMNPAIDILDGFTITNGTGFSGDGGGAYIEGFQGTIANATFEGNSAEYDGGGLFLTSSFHDSPDVTTVTLQDVRFVNNQSGQRGGGLFVESNQNTGPVEILLVRTELNGNTSASQGGGVYAQAYANWTEPVVLKFQDSLVTGNTSVEGGGAYVSIQNPYDPNAPIDDLTITDTQFVNNVASLGGGLYADSSVYSLDSSFSGNGITNSEMDAAGGGIYSRYLGVFGYRNTFTNNHVSAVSGKSAKGGAAALEQGGVFLSYSTFTGNSAGSGGVFHAGERAQVTLSQSTMRGNSATGDGGVLYASGGHFRLESNIISGNTAGGQGGAVAADHVPNYKSPGYLPTLLNNTISGNHAAGGGAAVALKNYSKVMFTNNIIAFNDSGILADATSALEFRNNDIFGNLPGADFQGVANPVGTLGNIAADPLFVDRVNGDYHLTAASPGKDAGDSGPFYYFSRDAFNSARVRGASVDIGAHELPGAAPLIPAFQTQPTGDASPGLLLQQPVVRVLDANGSVKADYNGPVTIALKPGVGTAGALLGGTTTVTAVNGIATFTDLTIDRAGVAYLLHASVPGYGGVDSSALTITVPVAHVAVSGNDANDGGTWATAKRTPQAGLFAAQRGGAVWIAAGTYYTGVMVQGASLLGGFSGVETDAGQRNPALNAVTIDALGWSDVVNIQPLGTTAPEIDGLTLRNAEGSGVLNFADNVTISNNLISGNNGDSGAGLMSFGDGVRITRNRFDGNVASLRGGAISIPSGSVMIDNNLLSGNTGQYGSAIDLYGYAPVQIVNNTIVGGIGGNGAVYLDGNDAVIANNIVAGNASGIFRAYESSPQPTLTNNLVFGNGTTDYTRLSPGTTDVSLDPLFANTVGGDYRLTQGSPAVDAGDDSFLAVSGLDLAGQPRQSGAHLDIGAFEWMATGPIIGDAVRALQIAGGLTVATPQDVAALDAEPSGTSQGKIDLLDALRLLRQATGAE